MDLHRSLNRCLLVRCRNLARTYRRSNDRSDQDRPKCNQSYPAEFHDQSSALASARLQPTVSIYCKQHAKTHHQQPSATTTHQQRGYTGFHAWTSRRGALMVGNMGSLLIPTGNKTNNDSAPVFRSGVESLCSFCQGVQSWQPLLSQPHFCAGVIFMTPNPQQISRQKPSRQFIFLKSWIAFNLRNSTSTQTGDRALPAM